VRLIRSGDAARLARAPVSTVATVATIAIAVIGLYATHSLRRQQRLKIAERRVDAYRKLWSLLVVARPLRMNPPENMPPLSRQEARTLYDEMTSWYFVDGNGMMFPDETKRVYLGAKERLGLYADGAGEAPEEGRRRMVELGLLRQQMRSDLAIYGHSYMADKLDADDEEFLRACRAPSAQRRDRGPGTAARVTRMTHVARSRAECVTRAAQRDSPP
jgi:hypothetical protein